jgi:hypothetical protein
MSEPTPRVDPRFIGAEALTDDDRQYQGSRFQEVREAIFANPYYSTWGAADEPPLPIFSVNLPQFLTGVLPFGRKFQFFQATKRAVDSDADLRWGPDRRGFRRLLHPNGVCLTGKWHITEPTEYSGYFQPGSEGLLIARYSTCCTATQRGQTRSLALVGKLYPTTDPTHAEPLRTASFITQQDLGGDFTAYINDAEVRNAPDTRAWRRGLGVPILLITGVVFLILDKEPATRQLYEIAELGKPADQPTRTPEFIRFLVADEQPRIEGDRLDFRDEILAQIYDKGDAEPKRELIFHIEVSDDGSTRGLPIYQRRLITNWRRIGRLVFDAAVASYNGDYVLHFNHPTWRHDRNDPSTAVRVNGRKVG